MPIKFLIDENSWRKALVNGLKAFDLTIDVLHIGDQGALPNQTADPDILRFCEREQRILVTRDKKTIPGYVRIHLQAGHHHWGVLYLRPGHSIGEYLDYLTLLWGASEPEEYFDQEVYIP